MLNRKIIFFIILAYLFQFIIETMLISSSSFFINSVGADKLPTALIISSILTPIFIYLMSILEVFKNSRQTKLFLLFFISLCLLFYVYYNKVTYIQNFDVWFYYIFSNIFSIISIILYWNLINSYFYVFESKMYFSYFIISEEIGAITSDLIINKLIYDYSISKYFVLNFFVILILTFIFFYIKKLKKINDDFNHDEKINFNSNKLLSSKQNFSKNKNLFNVIFLYIIIFCSFYFVSTIINYQFNYAAGEKFKTSDELNKFFSEFQLYSSLIIIGISFFFNKYLFPNSKIIFQHLLYAISILALVYLLNIHYTFYIIAFAELMKIVLEHSLFQNSYEQFTSTFTEKISDKLRNLSEGLFAPVIVVISGALMLFVPSRFSFYNLNLLIFIFMVVLIILIVLIKKIYYNYHLMLLKNNVANNNIRSIQALGEKNNYDSLDFLNDKFYKTSDKFVKKNIIISIGKINSRESIDFIFNVLNEGDEFLQSAAVDALFLYKSYKVHFLLVEFIQGEKNKSIYVRHKIILFINKIYKNAIIPFFMHLLYANDARVVANTIENFWDVNDKNILPFIAKFLNHQSNRVRANAIILLFKYNIKYYNDACIKSINQLRKSRNINDSLSFVFVAGFLKLKQYSLDIVKKYENIKDSIEFKDKLIENFAFSLASLNSPIGYDLFHLSFLTQKKFPNTLMYKFKLIDENNRILIIKNFFENHFGVDVENNLYENFKSSIYDFSFEIEVIEELLNK